ncbi:MAG: hypothetical protein ACP5HS_02170 [Anaerolineae bacterium]
MAASRFEFSGFMPPGGQDPLGIWAIPEEGITAFAASERGENGLVWRADLPASAEEAEPVLGEQLSRLALRQRDLTEVARRLARFNPTASYAAGGDTPEARLRADLMALQNPAVAFESRADEVATYEEIYEECRALLSQFRQLIQESARVETQVGGQDIALTAVDWTGDYKTTWLDGLTSADMELHVDAVRLALATRLALVRLIAIVASGALELSLKAAVPGGQFLLLPAVYRYVRDVLEELDRLRDGESWD